MHIVIIGGSAAGMAAAKALRQQSSAVKITVLSSDPAPYARCMLHQYVSGERSLEQMNFLADNFFEYYRIVYRNHFKVEQINRLERVVSGEKESVSYDKLLIAAGSVYNMPPIPNFPTAANVFGFRDFSDAEKIERYAKQGSRAFIVGSGLVGMDAAYALLARGVSVTVAEMGSRIIPLQTDEIASAMYQRRFEEAGATFLLGTGASDSVVDSHNRVTEVVLSDGQHIECDFVVAAAGVRPNIEFLRNSGLSLERGIVVDDYLQTSDSDVYAAGDITALSGIWPNAVRQGEIAAGNLLGESVRYTERFWIKNAMNFFGLPMISIGDLYPKDDHFSVYQTYQENQYKKIIMCGSRVTGIQLAGDVEQAGFWQYLITSGFPVADIADPLFSFGMADFYGMQKDGCDTRKSRMRQVMARGGTLYEKQN